MARLVRGESVCCRGPGEAPRAKLQLPGRQGPITSPPSSSRTRGRGGLAWFLGMGGALCRPPGFEWGFWALPSLQTPALL